LIERAESPANGFLTLGFVSGLSIQHRDDLSAQPFSAVRI
jgi:hypothetical protein